MKGLVFAVASIALTACGRSAQPPLEHPYLVYTHADRDRIARVIPTHGRSDDPTARAFGLMVSWPFERKLSDKIWEGNRADSLFRLSIVCWVQPQRTLRNGTRLLDLVPGIVSDIQAPGPRRGEGYLPTPGQSKGGWGRLLDASSILWEFSVAYDMLSAPEFRQAGLNPSVLDDLYARVVDGGFHAEVDHLRTISQKNGWDGHNPTSNNWTSREMAGVGMACLAFQDRLQREPSGSQRRQDFDDGLRLVRSFSKIYLNGWSDAGEPVNYYYEGPHYLWYWAEYFIPFAYAHQRLYPDPEFHYLSLAADAPLSRFLRCQVLAVMPTEVSSDGTVSWSDPPIDDTWLEPLTAGQLAQFGAAWIPLNESDRRLFLGAAHLTGAVADQCLLGNPVLLEAKNLKPEPFPKAAGTRHYGLAILRTGSEPSDLSVVLKNTRTFYSSKPSRPGVPTLESHTHSDPGSVVAFKDGEPILIDPGYGSNGFQGTSHQTYFTNWSRHNVLMVEGDRAYPDEVSQITGEREKFILPAFAKDQEPDARVDHIESVPDQTGGWEYAEAISPIHHRAVIVPDSRTILVVDRLSGPRRIKLSWWGNGTTSTASLIAEGKFVAKPEQIAEMIGGVDSSQPTASFDPAHGEGVFFRGRTNATKIKVYLPSPFKLEQVDGRYGPMWLASNITLTGMHVSSDSPVQYAVTLIEVEPKNGQSGPPAFHLQATPHVDGSGRLTSVTIQSDKGAATTYSLNADGTVSR